MQYVKLDNNSYIVNLSTGMAHITRKSFNYNKIKRLIDKNAAEEDILPLLIPPETPNGVYEVYFNSESDILYYLQMKDSEIEISPKTIDGTTYYQADDIKDVFLGVYASIEDIYADWPEYAI